MRLCPWHGFERRECSAMCEWARYEMRMAARALSEYWRDRAHGARPRRATRRAAQQALLDAAKALIDWLQGDGSETTMESSKRVLLLQVAITRVERGSERDRAHCMRARRPAERVKR